MNVLRLFLSTVIALSLTAKDQTYKIAIDSGELTAHYRDYSQRQVIIQFIPCDEMRDTCNAIINTKDLPPEMTLNSRVFYLFAKEQKILTDNLPPDVVRIMHYYSLNELNAN